MHPIAIILYEDQATSIKEFGLHNLVMACVIDEIAGQDRSALNKKLSGRPMNGIDNLLADGRKEIRRIAPQGQAVFALIDDDKIRRHVKVPATADEVTVIRAIKEKCVVPSQFEVFLLWKNTETIIETAALCSDQLPRDAIRRALQKDINSRDRIFNNVAWGMDRAVRDCIRRKVPALEKLVAALGALVASPPA